MGASNKMKVDVYFNLHKKVFSIRSREKETRGKVIKHTDNATIKNAKFVVSEKGRQRVLRERRKNVHAQIRGDLVSSGDINNPKKAYYNPYTKSSFVNYHTGEPVKESDMVVLKLNGKTPTIEYK